MNIFVGKEKGKGEWKYHEQKFVIPTSGMEYVNDINIVEAIIHVLDTNMDEPLLNNYKLELTDDLYKFLYKHIEKCFRDESLKYAVFNDGKSTVKELAYDYLSGNNPDLIGVSQEFAKQLFYIMQQDINIPGCDLITVSLSTDIGPMLAILKMDYVKSFAHKVDFVDNKLGIGIVQHEIGLPASSSKVQKCAFIKPYKENQEVNLMIIDNQKRKKDEEDYIINYFTDHYLGCTVIANDRDMTKNFINRAEGWTRVNLADNLEEAIRVREVVKNKIKEEIVINIDEVAKEIFEDNSEMQKSFSEYIEASGIEKEIAIDKAFVEKRMKKIRLNIDGEIDIYLSDEVYREDKFEIIRNGDGTVNIVIRAKNIIEK